ncbi:MAG: hypothetical protein WBC91_23290 [Phototrophicaceae bacterium]
MKIQRYDGGTSIEWKDEAMSDFQTGIVRARFYHPDLTDINGETIEIHVIGQSSTYQTSDTRNERCIIIDHTKVTLKK